MTLVDEAKIINEQEKKQEKRSHTVRLYDFGLVPGESRLTNHSEESSKSSAKGK